MLSKKETNNSQEKTNDPQMTKKSHTDNLNHSTAVHYYMFTSKMDIYKTHPCKTTVQYLKLGMKDQAFPFSLPDLLVCNFFQGHYGGRCFHIYMHDTYGEDWCTRQGVM